MLSKGFFNLNIIIVKACLRFRRTEVSEPWTLGIRKVASVLSCMFLCHCYLASGLS